MARIRLRPVAGEASNFVLVPEIGKGAGGGVLPLLEGKNTIEMDSPAQEGDILRDPFQEDFQVGLRFGFKRLQVRLPPTAPPTAVPSLAACRRCIHLRHRCPKWDLKTPKGRMSIWQQWFVAWNAGRSYRQHTLGAKHTKKVAQKGNYVTPHM